VGDCRAIRGAYSRSALHEDQAKIDLGHDVEKRGSPRKGVLGESPGKREEPILSRGEGVGKDGGETTERGRSPGGFYGVIKGIKKQPCKIAVGLMAEGRG